MKRMMAILALLACTGSLNAQDLNGNWEGTLNTGGNKIPVVFHITREKDGYSASFDSPSQQAFNLAVSKVSVNPDSVVLTMPILNGRYSGRLSENGKEMTGLWYQGKFSLPLNMKKTSETSTTRIIKRPQDPKPPFPYRSEDLLYYNADSSIRYGATFTVPLPDPNVEYFRAPVYPTVLLITGSGMQDRDESLMNHRPFAVIADHFSRNGIAVLRVDDRGTGKTTGDFNKATSADFARDVEAGIRYLMTRKDVDTTQLGLLGHSEGGMIAPMVAARKPEVKFIILLAGPGVKIMDLMEQQAVDVSVAAGMPEKYMNEYRTLYRNIFTAVLNEKDTALQKERSIALFKEWEKSHPKKLVRQTTGVTDEQSLIKYINEMIRPLRSPWFDYFLRYDPETALSKVSCPVLALNGEKDIQVSAKPNLTAIESILKKNGNNLVTVKEMPGLNHLFQHCHTCTITEYGDLEETIAPEALELMVNWIKQAHQ